MIAGPAQDKARRGDGPVVDRAASISVSVPGKASSPGSQQIQLGDIGDKNPDAMQLQPR